MIKQEEEMEMDKLYEGIPAVAVGEMSQEEVYELMYHMKHFCEAKPEEAAQMLYEHVEFARALAQIQLRLNMFSDTKSTMASNAILSNAAPVVNPGQLMESLDAEQQELLEQVQNLAPEVIQSLPPNQRKQIMELREAMGLPPV